MEQESGVEIIIEKEAIRDGKAHFLLTKLWGSVDFGFRNSLARQGLTMVPDGNLRISVPVETNYLTFEELSSIITSTLETFSNSYQVLVRAHKIEEKGDF